jgi:MoxR-like ATPase
MYDAVSHFRSSYDKNITSVSTKDFIELKAMGLAIASSLGAENAEAKKISGVKNYNQVTQQSSGSVVLIDEIDKAPRDFPNDLLNEIENYEFEIKEINQKISLKGNADSKPLFVLMTSNNERVLPEPFLRRCIYYHIPFPDTEQLTQIVLSKSELKHLDPQRLTNAINYFKTMRDKVIQKKPATAELIDWIKILNIQGIFDNNIDFAQLPSTQKEKFAATCYALFKNKQDYDTIIK